MAARATANKHELPKADRLPLAEFAVSTVLQPEYSLMWLQSKPQRGSCVPELRLLIKIRKRLLYLPKHMIARCRRRPWPGPATGAC